VVEKRMLEPVRRARVAGQKLELTDEQRLD
jgi:hypothetical protein